ncbi:methyltransferase domain-containing protein [Occallatibacter savannae]|uniref:methyltransferase domain-containing protein n=1 Tax=Occallatibacter savannae TaxID=1002691 RepID=UPI001EF3E250|nr:methyltransferase domain-containing protein [Occallatibacter savannae]
MSTGAAVSPSTSNSVSEINQLKARLKATWMTGDYDVFSRYLEPDAHLFFRRIGVEPGQKVLDVGCGTGQLALIAARAGAVVTGCDIATNSLERARSRALQEKLAATFDEGDAEALPYPDAHFDVVTSLVGAMFAPRPDLVASELVRVCKPGGKIAMANWTPQGFVGQMFKIIARYIAPNGMPSPVLWGDQATVHERFREGVLDLRCTYRHYQFEYPFPPDVVVDFFREHYGPMTRAFGALDPEGQKQLKADLVALWSANNRGVGNATLVDSEYLEIIAIRGDRDPDLPFIHSIPVKSRKTNHRAKLLADRIEEGAARLADFAGRLTDAEWATPTIEGGKQGRTAGVIIHHVASMYPIEIGVAQSVASGKTVTDVTWEVVAGINARHAADSASVGRAETIELLLKNSREAADVVRAFTDEELDRAAPFSLNSGAPVTAQFVVEDHALRHSWHHLARLREILGHHTVTPSSRIS